MIPAIPPSHPYWQLRTLAQSQSGVISKFNLSYYEYVPQSLLDTRQLLAVSLQDFLNEAFIEKIIQSTPSGCDLAFHSLVTTMESDDLHIPMVDMSTGSAAQLEKLRPFLSNFLFNKFKWYKSGRSFHGYANALVVPKEWASLMGKLLLANQKGLHPAVDPRWIGHRLIAGYSALRWTKNTAHYIELPRAID